MASFLLGEVAFGHRGILFAPEVLSPSQSIRSFCGRHLESNTETKRDAGTALGRLYAINREKQSNLFLRPNRSESWSRRSPWATAFAGSKLGAASYGSDAPEKTYYKAFGPRVGLAYAIAPGTVIRTGYGIFFEQAYYPGWNGGIATDGFNETVTFNSSLGGIQPAFLLQSGLPQNFAKPPFLDSSFLNGQNAPNYRPVDANRRPYTQQWNFTIEHQVGQNILVTAAYVGNKGTRLLSQVNAINALNPSLLSLGNRLNDQFAPGQTALDGVSDSLFRMGSADDRLRTYGRTGVAAVSPILRQYLRPE